MKDTPAISGPQRAATGLQSVKAGACRQRIPVYSSAGLLFANVVYQFYCSHVTGDIYPYKYGFLS